MKLITILTVFALSFSSCDAPVPKQAINQTAAEADISNGQVDPTNFNSNYQEVIVEEVIQVSGYTYLRVNENDQSKWLSVPTMEAKVGEKYFYTGGTPMVDFVSKTLDRTFDNILFLQGVTRNPNETIAVNQTPRNASANTTDPIQVEPLEGGITIGELMKDKEKYDQKEVMIRGKVTKYNEAIMKTNWIHIEDGTGHNGNVDLTITSQTRVKVGDIIIVKGTVTLEKDFGAGYKYEIIIENGSVNLDRKG